MIKVGFPNLGEYNVALKDFAILFGDKVILPSRLTKKTLEMGTKHSPDTVCVPYKYNLGAYIESLENGANLLLQAGAGCRFGFYAEPQFETLKELGYKFKWLKFDNSLKITKIINHIKKVNPKIKYRQIIQRFF